MLCCRLGYERELLAILTQLVKDMDRKIERQKERAAKESAPRAATPAEQATLDAIKVAPSRPLSYYWSWTVHAQRATSSIQNLPKHTLESCQSKRDKSFEEVHYLT